MNSIFWQRIGGTAAAVGIYLLAHRYPDVAAELGTVAGGLLGWLNGRRPGDVKLEDGGKS